MEVVSNVASKRVVQRVGYNRINQLAKTILILFKQLTNSWNNPTSCLNSTKHYLPLRQINLGTWFPVAKLLWDYHWQLLLAVDHRCLYERIHILQLFVRIVFLFHILAHRLSRRSSFSQIFPMLLVQWI